MTLQQLIDGIKRLTHKGNVETTSDVVTSTILDAFNLARRDILLKLPKYWLRTTSTLSLSSGTATYPLASDVQKAFLFRFTINNSDRFLKEIYSEEEFYKRIFSTAASNNIPEYFFNAGVDSNGARQIIVYPTPDRSITVNYSYYKTWTTDILTGTSAQLSAQIPEIPIHLHNVVFHGTKWYFLQAYDDPQQEIGKREFELALIDLDMAENQSASDNLAFRWGKLQSYRA